MYFGLDVPTTGEYADALVLGKLAQEAEAAGWDGFFVWDVMSGSGKVQRAVDPWVALSAIALLTERIKIGTMVVPLARHRPWLVARRLANLDQMSDGRVICGLGLGHQDVDFTAFGEDGRARTRAEKLDEGLAILDGLWTSDDFSFSGKHFNLNNVTVDPKPVQKPRIPIWLVGGWPRKRPFQRSAQWDGACLMSVNTERGGWLTLDDFRAAVEYIRSQRQQDGPFDIVMTGELPDDPGEASEKARAFAEAGATWWLEEGLGWELEEWRERIHKGPPRLA